MLSYYTLPAVEKTNEGSVGARERSVKRVVSEAGSVRLAYLYVKIQDLSYPRFDSKKPWRNRVSCYLSSQV